MIKGIEASFTEILASLGDRVQNARPPQIRQLSMLSTLCGRSLRKWQTQESYTRVAFPPGPVKQVTRLSCERCLPHACREGASLSPRQRDTEENPNTQASLSLPPVHSTHLKPFSYHTCPPLSPSITPRTKTPGFNHFYKSAFPYKGSCVT